MVWHIDSLAGTVGPKVAKQENTHRQAISEGHIQLNDEIFFTENERVANSFWYLFKGAKTNHL
jgi:hypothetical protein